MRTGGCCQAAERKTSRFPRKERLHMPGSLTTPGRPGARDDAPDRIAFHKMHCVGTQDRKLSRLNGWPMRPPVNASPRPSRATAHDSGPMWIANPSSQGTSTLCSLPVSRRFAHVFRSTPESRRSSGRELVPVSAIRCAPARCAGAGAERPVAGREDANSRSKAPSRQFSPRRRSSVCHWRRNDPQIFPRE
jgi:hypothetical protein